MSAGVASLQPTYQGHVATTRDALILFEACLLGQRHHVPRRPHDRERAQLIQSGCVFIYEENASGIKRWTDGVPWSPSRILGNFLVYRELLKPFPPGEKKRATKRAKRPTKPGEPYPRTSVEATECTTPPSQVQQAAAPVAATPTAHPASAGLSPTSPTTPGFKPGEGFDRETERALIGSLVDSYGFKEGGLVKKTMSVNVNGVNHHLVSYYKVEDVLSRDLGTPSTNDTLRFIKPRPELTSRQNFRAPLDDLEEGFDPNLEPLGRHPYDYHGDSARPRLGPHGYPTHHPPPPPPGLGYPAVEGLPYSTGAPPHLSGPSTYGLGPPPSTQAYYGHNAPAPHIKEEYGMYPNPGSYPARYEPVNPARYEPVTQARYEPVNPARYEPVNPGVEQGHSGPAERGPVQPRSAYQQEHLRQGREFIEGGNPAGQGYKSFWKV
ncbi:MAG: hypothetical protein M1816_001709 [Peltula sp. TS41687]|nr:MAG: hypothetical protein M1816_001709 [Peltula sp. TS41687]